MKEGMVILDVGCGPGFFTIPAAKMVGNSGTVIAADLQEKMLAKVKNKISGTGLENRIILHKASPNRLGLSQNVDLALVFYVMHEVLDAGAFFNEIYSHLNDGGFLYLAEPKFHVSKKAFQDTVEKATQRGFIQISNPAIFLSRAVVLRKE